MTLFSSHERGSDNASKEPIHDPVGFFTTFDLHDVRIDRIEFDTDNEALDLFLSNISVGHEESPHYRGNQPCVLSFRGVEKILIDVETYEGIRISHASVVQESSLLRLELDLNLGGGDLTCGRRSVSITFKSLHRKKDRD